MSGRLSRVGLLLALDSFVCFAYMHNFTINSRVCVRVRAHACVVFGVVGRPLISIKCTHTLHEYNIRAQPSMPAEKRAIITVKHEREIHLKSADFSACSWCARALAA